VSAVSLSEVSKSFALQIGGRTELVQALRSISFDVCESEFVALIGPSGCGKTTALRIVMGLDRATGGRVSIHGKSVQGCGHDRGLVFQHAELLPWLTALENVMFGLEMKGVRGKPLREAAMRSLELVGLQHAADRRPYQLSGGMKQRVGIARALAIDPEVLLMDEPFGALDSQTRESLQTELLDIHARTRKTILFVTHDLDEAVLLADRVVVMRAGAVADIVSVPLPRPRGDLGEIRALPEFVETRHLLWTMLRDPQDPAH
jgi:NitT/TauT family transport system ATP-binding protein